MPKRARQSHIPSQVRKRKPVRRAFGASNDAVRGNADFEATSAFLGNEEGEPVSIRPPRTESRPPVGRPAGRRLEQLSRTRDQIQVRTAPGQLPTFERSYLISELRRIAIISGLLLAVIIALALILR